MGAKTVQRRQIVIENAFAFRGDYVDVPIPAGVDMSILTEGDKDPFFVSLPLGEAGQITRNNRQYGLEEMEAIRDAINEQRVTGGLGHLREEERPYRFDVPVLHWVGAVIESGQLWGKAYVPKSATDVREYLRLQMRKHAPAATSLYGRGYEDYVEETGAYRISDLQVEQVDLVNPHRAGASAAASKPPRITTESDQTTTNESMEGDMPEPNENGTAPQPVNNTDSVDVDARLAEMQEQHRNEIRESRDRIRTLESQLRDMQTMTQIVTEAFGADDGDPVDLLRAIVAERNGLRVENQDLLRTEIEAQIADRVAIEHLRPVIAEMVSRENPDTRSAVRPAVDRVLAREHVTLLLRHAVAAESGPKQDRPVKEQEPEPSSTDEMFIIYPEDGE